ncbi:hypothetical protein HYU13_03120 [Candidatus Woesearchaeota archaeon]|nr:hypothetical protein [Candidatus Woesearchaeota archaeon]
MGKKFIFGVAVILLSFALFASAKTVVINETEMINLGVRASDPDQDNITVSYSPPLDSNGFWQTDYGDAGLYNITIAVSDGELTASEAVVVEVIKKNVPPEMISISPREESIQIKEAESVTFAVEAKDRNKDAITITWDVNSKKVSEGDKFVFTPYYGEAGRYEIEALLSDGEEEIAVRWAVDVKAVDRAALLESFSDITIQETQSVSLKIPDFGKLNLEYEISPPLESNFWQTGYEDKGEYPIKVTVRDGDFKASKEFTLTVLDKDRPPVIAPIGPVFISETQEAAISVEASDPDGDEVEIAAEGLPEGATFDGKVFKWATSYDAVQKDNFIKRALEAFHLLYSPHKITFVASANGQQASESAIVWVKDVNRAPILEVMEDISAEEGESITLSPVASDPDGDPISFSFSGWKEVFPYQATYEDEGVYTVLVTASDSFLDDRQEVKIEVRNKNRPPVITPIPSRSIKENETVAFQIDSFDPDGDKVALRMEGLPPDARFSGNAFSWKPGFDAVGREGAAFIIGVSADDGKGDGSGEGRSLFNITVADVNRAPEIISTKPAAAIKVEAGKPAIFEVKAIDPDGDNLQYLWDFGLFEEFNGSNAIKRTFRNPGAKKVRLDVSDGLRSTSHEWAINVVSKPSNKK